MKIVYVWQEKSLKVLGWEKYRYSHLFFVNWGKIFAYIGKSMEISSHICESYGLFNSIYFYSKPIVWEYISFPHNILIVWNFTLRISCGLFGFCRNFWFPQKPTGWEWYGFPHNISILWEFLHSQTLGIALVFINSKL